MIVDAIGTYISSLVDWLMPNQLLADFCGHWQGASLACIACCLRGFVGALHEGHRQVQTANALELLGIGCVKQVFFALVIS